jgi:diguanylate cyclase (GGDEF)-like protein
MGSFKLKLVAWFALLALLPLAVAFYGYDTLTTRSETRRADAVLEAGLRAAVAGYATRLDQASATARSVAAEAAVQHALRARDRAAVRRIDAAHPLVTVRIGGGSRAGAVSIVDGGRVLGSIAVNLPVDDGLVHQLGRGLSPSEHLVAARGGRIVAGVGHGQSLALSAGEPARLTVAGRTYRALQTAPLAASRGLVFAVLVPQHSIDAAVRSAETRILSALLASLLLFAVATYLLGRSVVGTLRRLADAANAIARGSYGERVDVRGRDEFAELAGAFNHMAAQLEQRVAELDTARGHVRATTARFGEALTATHDPEQLIRVVVESAVEVTGASGGVVLGLEGEIARAGDPDAGAERLAFPLRVGASDFGSLVIAGDSFDAGQVETAASLAAQVVVALENARLHRLVQHQAMADSLTGLANRRSLEETLRSELARAARFGDSVCVVFADLDNFKLVNDRHGHAAGDEVLKAFAITLRRTVRESDVAARWGGEEFALVLTGTDAPGGAHLAERARLEIESRPIRMPDGEELFVTASFGVASFPECEELGELLAAADSALYAAKRAGRNQVVVSTESAGREIV